MDLADLDFIGKSLLRAPPMGHREQPVLDVPSKADPSRLRRGQGAKNFGLVRSFAIDFRPAATDKEASNSGESRPDGTHSKPGSATSPALTRIRSLGH